MTGSILPRQGFVRVKSKETGRPGYAPADLLKLYIYGYLNRIRSSRRLEAETHRNIEVIWLLRHLKPDFKTIADFRRDNRNAFRPVFRQFVLLCKQLDLFGRELLAVDGTRIKAVNNKDRNFTRASLTEFIELADKKLDDYLQRLDTSDAAEQKAGGSRVKNLAEKIAAVRERRARCQTMLAELDRTGENQISLTDPDSRAMAAHTHVAVGYNVQSRSGCQAQADRRAAGHQPGRRYGPADADGRAGKGGSRRREDRRCRRPRLFQDRGYRGLREGRDDTVCSASSARSFSPGRFLPQGRVQIRRGVRTASFAQPASACSRIRHLFCAGLKKINYANRAACRDCPLRSRCTGNQFRSVSRMENEAVLDRMAARLAQRPGILDRRRETVEHPFGTIKQWMYQGAFLMRGLEKVRGEFSLTALAYNLRRALNLVGFAELMAAVQAVQG